MPRFFCQTPLSVGALVDLPADIAHHAQVLRLQPGDAIQLFNGEGGCYVASLTIIEKKRASAEVKVFLQEENELPFSLNLVQALPEGSKMDWIIEKAVELGVSSIQPVAAQRSVVRLSAERAEKKLTHWEGVIRAASEQCGRNRLAHLATPVDIGKWLQQQDLHPRIMLSPRAGQSLADWARHHPPQAISLLIGPEGGLTEQEENLAIQQGVLSLSMGSRILRTETAGLTAIAILSAAWGGM
ncbi:16S rRNA (uracil(1498)-N(3))-methyltransferase [Undibacterium oligocarboniphilum]|uniref:Ribosomal RNA small subunit methyltransferase E n=1 Tax=Undibacterium oligocarboniphilum TaxID=666702 RepID=A0A850QSI2_9BURK|nr:16S rRNA (uracil(1498)-N(3))-methyltransferase [Undibacterium oligocarboniphilum]MBC3871824.1 16S rRNA (uracil(1498)-N(3))-methyltransferase [Undibacterium oligocarboniphilum]NVO79324.1 16S rRNA (uracil(1498)-N(3))-methyltransferase [Undibacterium oligocarboniphilum]